MSLFHCLFYSSILSCPPSVIHHSIFIFWSLQCVSEISKDFLSSSLLFTRSVPSSFTVSLVLPLVPHYNLFTVENSTSLQTIPLLVFLSTSFLSSLAGLSYSCVSLLHTSFRQISLLSMWNLQGSSLSLSTSLHPQAQKTYCLSAVPFLYFYCIDWLTNLTRSFPFLSLFYYFTLTSQVTQYSFLG